MLATSRAKPISWVAMQHGHALDGELADEREHLGDQLRVERARDLVEQHHARLHGQRAHDRDALLLTAREAVGVFVALVPEADPIEQRVGPRSTASRFESEHLPRRERHVARARSCAGTG